MSRQTSATREAEGPGQRPAAVTGAYPASVTYLDLMASNKRKSVALIGFMLALGAAIGAVIAAAVVGGQGDLLWPSVVTGAAVALVVGGLTTLWSWFGGAAAILAMSGAREIRREEDPELFNVVEEVSIAAGLPMPRVYVMQDSALNAFATGRDPAHAAVAITTGLRGALTRDELQGVMAHEVAHIRHYDIRLAMLMATMAGLIAFACDGYSADGVPVWEARSGRRGARATGARWC
ncbi:MAG: M48 family metalloprotease [Phycisphaeraceae bacterium]|nr:M48 family metalloprotease [Phycisphaeraceae bacterium]